MAALAQRVIKFLLGVSLLGILPSLTQAEKIGKVSHFLCTRSKEVNLRRGPGHQYPIDWKIVKARYPLQVIAEYGTWRKVRDCDDSEGWIHQGMLTAKPRMGVITTQTTLFSKGGAGGKVIAHIEPKVLLKILEIKPTWCRVEAEGHQGWVPRAHVWGVLKNE